ncbi:MAG: hypothetical protein LBT05_01635 [Planctomycetaceae bacterium]|jgi:hypothetical protein|nr:hypothetical protein [Planctomycetaceae bacterium]
MRLYSITFFLLFLTGSLFAQTENYVPSVNNRYLIAPQAPTPPESPIVNPLSQTVIPLPDIAPEPIVINPFQYRMPDGSITATARFAQMDHSYLPRANNRYLIAQQEPKPTESPITDPLSQTAIPLPDTAPSEPAVINPFQYRMSDGSIMMTPSRSSVLPQGIRIVGVLIMEDKKLPPIAAVQMPNVGGSASRSAGSDTIHYVREGEMLEVNRSMLNARSAARAPRNDGTQSETLFIEISKITPYQIEIHSKDNFEDKHIIR